MITATIDKMPILNPDLPPDALHPGAADRPTGHAEDADPVFDRGNYDIPDELLEWIQPGRTVIELHGLGQREKRAEIRALVDGRIVCRYPDGRADWAYRVEEWIWFAGLYNRGRLRLPLEDEQ